MRPGQSAYISEARKMWWRITSLEIDPVAMASAQVLIAIDGTQDKTEECLLSTTSSPSNDLYCIYAVANGSTGSLYMMFQGTSIALYGAMCNAESLVVSIDGVQLQTTMYGGLKSYQQWYQSPTLDAGPHYMTVDYVGGLPLDYAVLTPSNDTALIGQSIIVDNEDLAILFEGSWVTSGEVFQADSFAGGVVPYRNTTQQATQVGDCMTYNFNGTSAAIYGIFEWSEIGTMTLGFTLDGSSMNRTYSVDTHTPQFIYKTGEQQNHLFQSYESLSPGNHTLSVTVISCINKTFILDYITYSQSLASSAAIPSVGAPYAVNNAVSCAAGPPATISPATSSPATISPATDAKGNSSASHSVVAIVGGVLGAVVALLILALLIGIWRRRVNRNPFTARRSEIRVSGFSRKVREHILEQEPVAESAPPPYKTNGGSSEGPLQLLVLSHHKVV
ncbi:hypothetical protein B0H34DRAFT_703916 [Crassisporium funariophilum]|nr:hypothetical protein B0H34DRAFT_703916 [Crassisporium funariophilum]